MRIIDEVTEEDMKEVEKLSSKERQQFAHFQAVIDKDPEQVLRYACVYPHTYAQRRCSSLQPSLVKSSPMSKNFKSFHTGIASRREPSPCGPRARTSLAQRISQRANAAPPVDSSSRSCPPLSISSRWTPRTQNRPISGPSPSIRAPNAAPRPMLAREAT